MPRCLSARQPLNPNLTNNSAMLPIIRILLAPILFILVWLSGHAQEIHGDKPVPTWTVPPINPIPHWYEVRGGSWRVSLATVQEMRTLIESEISRNKHFYPQDTTPKFVIQFRGETAGTRQIVRIVGACNGLGKNEWELSQQFSRVFDGGKCYFEADYQPSEKQFQFRYNGYA